MLSAAPKRLLNNLIHTHHAMPNYIVKLSSGRDYMFQTHKSEYELAYEAYEEACLMDDYLVDIIRISDD